ncbi:MAG: hypothetical protein ACTSRV_00915 [Candidatus Freyarchaeota archaeon]
MEDPKIVPKIYTRLKNSANLLNNPEKSVHHKKQTLNLGNIPSRTPRKESLYYERKYDG